jgi:hypothetical protein
VHEPIEDGVRYGWIPLYRISTVVSVMRASTVWRISREGTE